MEKLIFKFTELGGGESVEKPLEDSTDIDYIPDDAYHIHIRYENEETKIKKCLNVYIGMQIDIENILQHNIISEDDTQKDSQYMSQNSKRDFILVSYQGNIRIVAIEKEKRCKLKDGTRLIVENNFVKSLELAKSLLKYGLNCGVDENKINKKIR